MYTVARIAELVGGTLKGDGSATITAALPISQAVPGSITFVAERKHLAKLDKCAASAVLLPRNLPEAKIPTIHVDDPLDALVRLAIKLSPPIPAPIAGVDPRAAVHPTAQLGAGVSIGPFAVIEAQCVIGDRTVLHPHAVVRGGCRVGDDCEIHSHAVLYPRTKLGHRTIVHGGAVLGGDGFGYKLVKGTHQKVPQVGDLVLGDDVEVGSNSTIDRATIGSTRIGDGTKIDNQVMIGHNCQIGRHNIFVSHVGMAGSCTTGDHVVLAGKAGIADHVSLASGVVLGAIAGVFTDIDEPGVYLGAPARPEREFKRYHLALEKVSLLREQVAEIRERLGMTRKDGPATRAAG